VAHNLACNETDAANIEIAIFLAKAEAPRQVSAHNITVENRDLSAELL
jgi:hypothetical protein